ncbi:MAG TPA: nucleotidyltransferase [Lachnospiraceae bacterium]|nr:nucleotidyltransferase [Lachnospiraceae bacterium]
MEKVCVEENTTISESIKRLDEAGEKILLVTKSQKLTGVITDGDIRRWILKKGSFDETVNKIMHRNPQIVDEGNTGKAKWIMLERHLEAIPVVDKNNIPIDIIFLRDIILPEQRKYEQVKVPVVIMAGGKGTRLYPYTNILPKPLIPIGSMTILERIIDSFRKNGCKDFLLILNYKKNLIKAYLEEQEKPYRIQYIEESDFFGTCGGIRLVQDKLKQTFFVSNCDVLLDIDFAELLQFHQLEQNEITVVTSLKHMQIPYGVVELDKGGEVKKISEKPCLNYNMNTGIYVMEPSVLNDIPLNQVFHVTDLMNILLKEHRRVGAYPIMEKCWQDMGEIDEMQKMLNVFQDK